MGSLVLDIGCGNGRLLLELARVGSRDLTGLDPYLPGAGSPAPGVRLLARTLTALQGETFDLLMFHHFLEHMPDHQVHWCRPHVCCVSRLCLVRLPVADWHAWRRYGLNWIELDAPRHLVLHSRRSFALTTRQAGLHVYHEATDIDTFPHWGSELYRRGLSFHDPTYNGKRSAGSIFSAQEIRGFEQLAGSAARRGQGKPAIFYLHPLP